MIQYTVFRGVDNEIEFKGLRGKFFYYAIITALGVIILTFLMYFLGVPIIMLLVWLGGGLASTYIGAGYLNKKYGKWGLDKQPIAHIQPKYVKRHVSFRTLIATTTIKIKEDGKD